MLLRVQDLAKRIGGRTLFLGVSLQLQRGDRIGLVGPNGAGKTTLLRLLSGDDPPEEGSIGKPKNVRIGMLRQEIDPGQPHSITQEAGTALRHLDELESEIRALEQEMSEIGAEGREVEETLAERYHRATTSFEHGGGFAREARVAAVLAGLGFDEEARGRPLSSFSGGWLMRVELAKLLLAEPDVLLLDEPTNHLDLPAIQWFEETLSAFEGAVVTVSHDRTFLRRNVDQVAELDGLGGFTTYKGSYDNYLQARAERRATLLAAKAKQDRHIAETERFVERFRAKATKAKQAQSRLKALDRLERIEIEPEKRSRIRLRIPAPPRSGDQVITLEEIHKSYGDKQVYQGISFGLRRGDRVALAGPNGAGKSTLLRLVANRLDFEQGTRTLGHNVQTGFYAQHQLESLTPSNTVLEELASAARLADTPRLRGHLGAFLFSGDDVEKRVSVLSGGEKARLALAKMLLHPANLLVLDEPTNHLDIQACEVLEDALGQYRGTLVFVSHDRSFINALATRVVEVKDGTLREFHGNYDDYQRKLQELENPPAAPSQRPKEKARAATPQAAPAAAPVATPPSTRGSKAGKAARQLDRDRRKRRERVTREVAKLEELIQQLESELESLGWKLGEPELYKDVDRMQALTAEREALEGRVADAYREWEKRTDELAALDDVAGD